MKVVPREVSPFRGGDIFIFKGGSWMGLLDSNEWKDLCDKLAAASTSLQVQEVRAEWIGRRGRITLALKDLSDMAPEERRQKGQILNAAREQATRLIDERLEQLRQHEEDVQLLSERLDMTIAGVEPKVGLLHPLTRVRRLLEDLFLRMGFSLAHGPEIETTWYNFEALNIPENHPARDMQDSFFVDLPGMVLRTHTSPVQIRGMEAAKGLVPVKIIAPGRVYRRDDDATHAPMFHQIEGLVVDRGITLGDLKGTLMAMATELLGESIGTRFRPSYFPFTEPSVEMDVTCAACGGTGCRTCKGTGWVEILGSGLVHPVVLQNGGYDPQEVSGFAFGLGIERLAMRIFGLDDLRPLYQNDLEYLMAFDRYTGRPML